MKKCENCECHYHYSDNIIVSGLCPHCLIKWSKLKTIVDSHATKKDEDKKGVFVTNKNNEEIDTTSLK